MQTPAPAGPGAGDPAKGGSVDWKPDNEPAKNGKGKKAAGDAGGQKDKEKESEKDKS